MAKWIGYITNKYYDFSDKKQQFGMPAAYIRREFDCDKTLAKATIKISALGVYSAFINGNIINDDFLSPGWTEYVKTVEYYEYDVTKYIRKGKNALAVILADGWYASNLSAMGKCLFGEYPLKLWYRIDLKFFDGSKAQIQSDGSEKATDGAIRYCDNQNGIMIDNRFDTGDISLPDNDIENVHSVEVFDYISPEKAICAPIKAQFRFDGKVVCENESGVIIDFLQNFAGVIDCVFHGKRGDKITVMHGEMLDAAGDLYTDNLRSALATDVYILGSDKEERFFPKLVFHGFRYAKIVLPKGVKLVKAQGVAIFSDMRKSGSFSCDNELLNKIYSNVLWGQRSNFLSVPTDCPQRDERLGWTGDAQIFCKTAMFNYNAKRFFEKYLRDICDSADIYGAGIPVTSPYLFDSLKQKGEYYIGWSGWSDAIIIIPYIHYLMYGDKSVLEKTLPYMKRYIRYIYENSENYIVGLPSFGDWLSIKEETDIEVYNTAYFAFSSSLLAKICGILHDTDESSYKTLYYKIKQAFKSNFIDEQGIIKSDTQTCYILAYSFGLIDKTVAKRAIKRKLKEFNYHLTTGFQGTKYLLSTLFSLGLIKCAYDILLCEDFPSWGYMIKHNATTIWERWDSFTDENGFNKYGMNSFNHYSLASCGETFYTHILGINPSIENPGWRTVRISPYFDERISSVHGGYKTPNGLISVSYKIKEDKVLYTLKVPEKTEVVFDFHNDVISSSNRSSSRRKVYDIVLKM